MHIFFYSLEKIRSEAYIHKKVSEDICSSNHDKQNKIPKECSFSLQIIALFPKDSLPEDENAPKKVGDVSEKNSEASVKDSEASEKDPETSGKDSETSVMNSETSGKDSETSVMNSEASVTDSEASVTNSEASVMDSEASVKDTEASVTDSETSVTDSEASATKTDTKKTNNHNKIKKRVSSIAFHEETPFGIKRRKSVGLDTIEDYITTMTTQYYGSLKK